MLVRNRLEAAQVREALQTLGIPSVYLSNRDSVFETLEARELLLAIAGGAGPGAGKYPAQRAGDVDVWPDRAGY